MNGRQSRAMADQLTTVSTQRPMNRIGRLSAPDMRKVEHAVMVQLGLIEITTQQ